MPQSSAGNVDAVAFGTTFLANPDLPAQIKANAELKSPNHRPFLFRFKGLHQLFGEAILTVSEVTTDA